MLAALQSGFLSPDLQQLPQPNCLLRLGLQIPDLAFEMANTVFEACNVHQRVVQLIALFGEQCALFGGVEIRVHQFEGFPRCL